MSGNMTKAAVLGTALILAQAAVAQDRPRSGEPGAGRSLSVTMLVEGSGQLPAALIGRTNLPDGSRLTVSLKRLEPPCDSNCGLTIPSLAVSGGAFLVADQATLKQVGPGKFQVEVVAQGAGQPESVAAVIGKLGEKLRGPFIVTTDAPGSYSPATFPRPSSPSMGEKVLGLMVRYVQIVDLDETSRRPAGVGQAKSSAKGAANSFDPASCRGLRSNLPVVYQDRCRSLDAQNGAYTPDWRPLGATSKIDMNSILRSTGGAEVVIYTGGGNSYDPRLEQKLIFDCVGHYLVAGAGITTLDALPGTIAGRASAIACGAKINTAKP
ncbi:MAG: hypothetical protein ACRC9K_24110 [Afipia sp.]